MSSAENAPAEKAVAAGNAALVPFAQLDHYAGFDWASDKHDVCVVDRAGTVVLELCFDDTAQGWAQLRQRLAPLGKVGVAIETSRGPQVERLLDMGLRVFPMNPKAAERFRDRKAPSGAKADALDAWSFADALRTDGAGWRPLLGEDPATQLLRILCRDEIALIEQRTALVLQLRQALHEYYPAALEAFDDWTAPSSWEFVVQFPTPAALAGAGKRRWQKFLHTQRLYCPSSAARRLEVFARAQQFVSPSASVTAAKSLLAVSLARMLRTLEQQVKEYRKRIEQAFADPPRRRPVRLAARRRQKAGPAAAGRDGVQPRAVRVGPSAAVLRGHGAGDQTERQAPAGDPAAGLQQGAAGDRSPVGGREPPAVRLGRRVLPAEEGSGAESRPGAALPRAALAQDPVADVA